MTPQPGTSPRPNKQQGWRLAFITGYAIQSVLLFVPSFTLDRAAELLGLETEGQAFSKFTATQYLIREGYAFLGLIGALIPLLILAFFIVSIISRRRWIYLAGATFGALRLLGLSVSIFRGDLDVDRFMMQYIVEAVAGLLVLAGFWVKR